MAVKKIGDAVFDSGAQFMTTRDLVFRERVETWLAKGEVMPWFPGPMKNMRYVGTHGMNTVPNRVGESLKISFSERVIKVAFKNKKWTVTAQPHDSKEKKTYKADWLILTAPVPQSMELLDKSGIELDYDEEEELRRITYARCMTVMAQLNGPSGVPNPGAMDLNHDYLRWIGDNSLKGISAIEGSITIHSSIKFAKVFWERSEDDFVNAMVSAAKPFIKSDVIEATGHRWKFSDPYRIYKEKQPFRKPYFMDESLQLGMAGDGFNGPRIESAALSGMELASAILNPL